MEQALTFSQAVAHCASTGETCHCGDSTLSVRRQETGPGLVMFRSRTSRGGVSEDGFSMKWLLKKWRRSSMGDSGPTLRSYFPDLIPVEPERRMSLKALLPAEPAVPRIRLSDLVKAW